MAEEKKPKNSVLGATESLKVDPADIERLSNQEDLKEAVKGLAPHVADAVVKRYMEKNAGKPKVKKKVTLTAEESAKFAKQKKRAAKKPTVRRGAGGRIESVRTPIAPVGDAPVTPKRDARTISRPIKKRRKTRSGKKLDKVTGQVLTPTVRRGESGKIEAIPKEERANITPLPAQEAVTQQPRPIQRPAIVRGGVRPEVKGGAVSYPRIHAAVTAAMGHLSNMRLSQRGSDEFTNHEKLFDAIHANIKPMSPELHLSLGQAKHHITTAGPKAEENLALVHKAINARLGIIKQAHEENIRRAEEGRARKAGQA